MSWTAPRTWVAKEKPTAALLNTHLRDNMLETEGAKATTNGYFVGAAANSIVERIPQYVINTGTTTATTTSYVTSPTSVSAVTSDRALVLWSCNFSNSTADTITWSSIAVSGASTIAADDLYAIAGESMTGGAEQQCMRAHFFVALTPGTNTFAMAHRVSAASTGTFTNRRIFVMPL